MRARAQSQTNGKPHLTKSVRPRSSSLPLKVNPVAIDPKPFQRRLIVAIAQRQQIEQKDYGRDFKDYIINFIQFKNTAPLTSIDKMTALFFKQDGLKQGPKKENIALVFDEGDLTALDNYLFLVEKALEPTSSFTDEQLLFIEVISKKLQNYFDDKSKFNFFLRRNESESSFKLPITDLIETIKKLPKDADIENEAKKHCQRIVAIHNKDRELNKAKQIGNKGVDYQWLHLRQGNRQSFLCSDDISKLMPEDQASFKVFTDLSAAKSEEAQLVNESVIEAIKDQLKKTGKQHVVVPISPGHYNGLFITKDESGAYQVELFEPLKSYKDKNKAPTHAVFAKQLIAKLGLPVDTAINSIYPADHAQSDGYSCGDFTVAQTHKKFKEWGFDGYSQTIIDALAKGNVNHQLREVMINYSKEKGPLTNNVKSSQPMPSVKTEAALGKDDKSESQCLMTFLTVTNSVLGFTYQSSDSDIAEKYERADGSTIDEEHHCNLRVSYAPSNIARRAFTQKVNEKDATFVAKVETIKSGKVVNQTDRNSMNHLTSDNLQILALQQAKQWFEQLDFSGGKVPVARITGQNGTYASTLHAALLKLSKELNRPIKIKNFCGNGPEKGYFFGTHDHAFIQKHLSGSDYLDNTFKEVAKETSALLAFKTSPDIKSRLETSKSVLIDEKGKEPISEDEKASWSSYFSF